MADKRIVYYGDFTKPNTFALLLITDNGRSLNVSGGFTNYKPLVPSMVHNGEYLTPDEARAKYRFRKRARK